MTLQVEQEVVAYAVTRVPGVHGPDLFVPAVLESCPLHSVMFEIVDRLEEGNSDKGLDDKEQDRPETEGPPENGDDRQLDGDVPVNRISGAYRFFSFPGQTIRLDSQGALKPSENGRICCNPWGQAALGTSMP